MRMQHRVPGTRLRNDLGTEARKLVVWVWDGRDNEEEGRKEEKKRERKYRITWP